MSNFLALSPPKTEKVRPKISSADKLTSINLKVVEANKILKENFLFDKKQLAERAKQLEKTDRQEEESELETPPETSETKPAKGLGIKMPKSKFLDGVKNFIFTVLIGFAATRLLKFLPAMVKLLKPLAAIANFFLKVGGVIVKSLIAFLDAGVKAFDFTRNAVKKTFGEDGVKKFDSFIGNLSKFLNLVMTVGMTAAAVSMAMADQSMGDGKPKPKRKIKSKFDPKDVKNRAKNIKRIRRQKQLQKLTKRFKPVTNFLSNLAPKNLLSKGKDIFEMGKTFVTKKYKQISKAVVNKFNQVTKGVSNAISGLNKKVQEQIAKRILEPFKKVLEPVIKPAKNLFDSLMKQIMKIPGLDKILKKIGLTSLGDAPKIASKFGAKALPWIGGLFNLLFAYDRFANGDVIGGLIETVSGGLDIAGIFPASMALDAYLFGRDMFPSIMEGEQKVLDAIPGLAPLEKTASNIVSKLPDLGALTKMITGEAKKEETVAKEGTESLQPINLGDSKNLDTSTLETEASYEGNKTETVMIGGEEQEVEIGDDGFMTDDQIEEFSQGDGGSSDDTTNDLSYKNGG